MINNRYHILQLHLRKKLSIIFLCISISISVTAFDHITQIIYYFI